MRKVFRRRQIREILTKRNRKRPIPATDSDHVGAVWGSFFPLFAQCFLFGPDGSVLFILFIAST